MRNRHLGDVVLSEDDIRSGVAQVAARLNDRYHDAVAIVVVPGGILYAADLLRRVDFPVAMDYISCPHTPGERHNASEIVYHANVDIRGRDVIVIDDAVESGGTMRRLLAHLGSGYSPASVAVATLFVKPGRVDLPAEEFYAYEMDSDDLLVGYGLPWDDHYRNVPYVSKLVP